MCSRSNIIEMNVTRPFIIGVGGGTASGKTSVCEKIMEKLEIANRRQIQIISMDSFYKNLKTNQCALANNGDYNFDHPDAFDFDYMYASLMSLRNGETLSLSKYNYDSCRREEADIRVIPQQVDVILMEGILVFYNKEIRDLFHMKLFVDSDPDTRLARRVLRYTSERGRDLDSIINQYIYHVKPAFEEFCLPTKKYADVIIPRGADNTVAIDLIVQHIQEVLLRHPNCTLPSSAAADMKRTRHTSDCVGISRPH